MRLKFERISFLRTNIMHLCLFLSVIQLIGCHVNQEIKSSDYFLNKNSNYLDNKHNLSSNINYTQFNNSGSEFDTIILKDLKLSNFSLDPDTILSQHPRNLSIYNLLLKFNYKINSSS